jgi:exosortase/archaeosortase family protein
MSAQNLSVISLLADTGNGEVQNTATDLPLVNGQDASVSTAGRIVHWDAEWYWDPIYPQYPHQALGGHVVALGLTEAHQIWQEYTLFRMLHVPVLREGYRFTVPHFTIEIAQQCSSIRSAAALLMTGVLAGHFFLGSNTRRIGLALITVLIAMSANAVRIVALTCLAVYVNPGFLFGRLYRSGGAAFSLLSVSVLLCLLALLRRSEAHGKDERAAGSL